jgi:hypothetical protein
MLRDEIYFLKRNRDHEAEVGKLRNETLQLKLEQVEIIVEMQRGQLQMQRGQLQMQRAEIARRDDGITYLLGELEARGSFKSNEIAAQDEAAMEISSTVPAITIEASTVPALEKGKRKEKFGHAPPIASYRSHERDVNGERYRTRSGRLYYGPICDSCESKGVPHFHHPLRCDRNHKHWRKPNRAPELNGVTGWTARTVGWARIGDPAPNRRERERNDQVHALAAQVTHLEGKLAERHTSQTVGVEM